jgi:hypothetical protein
MQKALHKILTNILAFTIVALPAVTLAQNIGIKNPATSIDSISGIVEAVVRIVRTIAIPFIVIMIMYTGWLFIAAQGNPDKLKGARTAFLWTMVGTMIVLSAELIASLIKNAFTR